MKNKGSGIIKSSKLYHLFLVLSVFNLLAYYLFAGQSVLDIHKTDEGFWDNKISNYYISVSFLILLIWLSYWIVRKRLTSTKLIWIHLSATFATVFILPGITIRFIVPMPRRYLDYAGKGLQLSDFYGSMTLTFMVVGIILLTSELLLISNVRQQPEKTTLFGSEI